MRQFLATPLRLAKWRSRLASFLYTCAARAPAEQPEAIREMAFLLRCRPAELRADVPVPPDERKLEAQLAAGAYESAAIALLGSDASFMASRGRHGVHLATVVLPEVDEEFTVEGTTLSLALLAALASSLMALAEHADRSMPPEGHRSVGGRLSPS